jgi:hypothetical protein
MHRFKLSNARENCHWLALTASLVILTSTIAVTLLWPSESQALNSIGDVTLSSMSGGYHSPQHCRECHVAEFQAWSGTSHADASFDPIFQVFLQQQAEPGECYFCHTTGYDSTTGRFVLAGVTCEACHGPYREGHPDESMVIAASEALCGTCHMSTLTEWASSRHGEAGVTCSGCHEVHTQQTHAAENTNTMCTGCHQEPTQDGVHTVHAAADVRCTTCHIGRPSTDVSVAVNGKALTGHGFAVFVTTCSDCHPLPLQSDEERP